MSLNTSNPASSSDELMQPQTPPAHTEGANLIAVPVKHQVIENVTAHRVDSSEVKQ